MNELTAQTNAELTSEDLWVTLFNAQTREEALEAYNVSKEWGETKEILEEYKQFIRKHYPNKEI